MANLNSMVEPFERYIDQLLVDKSSTPKSDPDSLTLASNTNVNSENTQILSDQNPNSSVKNRTPRSIRKTPQKYSPDDYELCKIKINNNT